MRTQAHTNRAQQEIPEAKTASPNIGHAGFTNFIYNAYSNHYKIFIAKIQITLISF